MKQARQFGPCLIAFTTEGRSRETLQRSLVLLALSSFALPAVAQEKQQGRIEADRIDQLITQLGSPQPQLRTAASRKLLGLGDQALTRLRGAAKTSPPEQGQRLQKLADRIEFVRDTRHCRLIFLGLINYEDINKAFPPAYCASKEGRPLLSWRVAILPHLGEQPLFGEFHHDEPWDSPHNNSLIRRMPAVYRAGNSKAAAGMTTYLGVGGKNGVITAPGVRGAWTTRPAGVRVSGIVDGRLQTLLFMEASDSQAVDWTRPEEWVPNEANPIDGLIGPGSKSFTGVFVDGFVQSIDANTDKQVLSGLFNRQDAKMLKLQREEWSLD